jgi:broad specificity phosphatase PhoE
VYGPIYLVRHGEPDGAWGVVDDPGLSSLGRAQATRAGETLSRLPVPPTSVITSPLARCQETARGLSQALGLNAPPLVQAAVGEIPTPIGITDRQKWLRDVLHGPMDALSDGLSTWASQGFQCVSALPAHTVVASHFVAINVIVSKVVGSDKVTTFSPGHASITVLEQTPAGLRLVSLGEETAISLL